MISLDRRIVIVKIENDMINKIKSLFYVLVWSSLDK